jgi:hypothetical protein
LVPIIVIIGNSGGRAERQNHNTAGCRDLVRCRFLRRLKSYIPNSDESLWTLVRGLGPGQALVSFTHIRRPVIAAIDPSPAKLLMTE